MCCISLPRKFRAKLPGRFRAKQKLCARCAPKTVILTLFADLRGLFQHQDDLGLKSDQLRHFSPLQDLQLCFWDHRNPKPYATCMSCARGLLDVLLARKFRADRKFRHSWSELGYFFMFWTGFESFSCTESSAASYICKR